MLNRDYIAYLNTLHNVNANNQNAYTETNTTNPYYKKTMVKREVGKYIAETLTKEAPHIFILTGHAGDGKTGLLYQVLTGWGLLNDGQTLQAKASFELPNGKKCTYIKDFSELEVEKRTACLQELIQYPSKGEYVFLVANTGPLISSFKEVFSLEAQSVLLGAIDENTGELQKCDGVPVVVVNVATVDNSAFVMPFLQNVLNEDLWSPCDQCYKREYCVICANRRIVRNMLSKVSDFIEKHYIWEQEHDTKLTIRQIVAHLSYSITGGLQCKSIRNVQSQRFKYLFTNLFFGYKGLTIDKNSANTYAISHILKEAYDQKRLNVDEELFIRRNLSKFPNEISEMLIEIGNKTHSSEQWQRAVRRAYMMLNIDTDVDRQRKLTEDVFSIWYPRYLELRQGETPGSAEKELLQDALQMMFVGTIQKNEKDVPVTMKREKGIAQCVQLVYDSIPKKKIKLVLNQINDYSVTKKRYGMYIQINGQRLNPRITLPLFNFFEETRRGAIETNVDPQLSQGLDTLKAQIISYCETESSEIELLTMISSGWKSITAELEDGSWRLS